MQLGSVRLAAALLFAFAFNFADESCLAQSALAFTPPPVGAYLSTDGATWNAWTATSGGVALPFTPPPAGLYCLSGTSWLPCVPGGGGGSFTPGGTTGQILTNNGTSTSSGAITATSANTASTLVERPSDLTQALNLNPLFIAATDSNNTPNGTTTRATVLVNGTCNSFEAGTFSGCDTIHSTNTIDAPSWNNGSSGTAATGWSLVYGVSADVNDLARGIPFSFGSQMLHSGAGDTGLYSGYIKGFFAAYHSADEGTVPAELQAVQLPYVQGTITSGATTGSSLIAATITHGGPYFNDEGILLRTTGGALYTATILTKGFNSSLNGLYYTTSGATFPVSTAWGTITPSTCTNNGNGQGEVLVTTTCTVTIGTSPASPGYLANNVDACVAGPFLERVQVTAVGAASGATQTMTFMTRRAWDNSGTPPNTNGAIVMQGSMCGTAFWDTAQASTNPVAFMALGATTSSTVYFAACGAGACNGYGTVTPNALQPVYPNPTFGNAAIATQIAFYAAAMIDGTNLGQTGQANLERNSVPFAVNDTVVGAVSSEPTYQGIRSLSTINTPSLCWRTTCDLLTGSAREIGLQINDGGGATSPVPYPLDAYIQFLNVNDAVHSAAAGLYTSGSYRDLFEIGNIPTDAIFDFRENFVSGMSPGSYNVMQFRGLSGLGVRALQMNSTTGALTYNGILSGNSLASTTSGTFGTQVFANTPLGTNTGDAFVAQGPNFSSLTDGPGLGFVVGSTGGSPVEPGRIFGVVTDFAGTNRVVIAVKDASGNYSSTYPLAVGPAGIFPASTKTTIYTVATLPSASSFAAGTQVTVSDATTFTVGTCTGGGSDYMIAITNGTSWSCH